MPTAPTLSWTAGDSVASARLTLLLHEVALVLDCEETETRALVDSGQLVDVSRDRHRRVAAQQLAELVRKRVGRGEIGPLAAFLLEEIVAGRLEVPRQLGDRFGFVIAYLRPRGGG